MNIFEFALEFEKENKEFYRERSKNTENSNLKSLFKDLVAEERKHEQIVQELKNNTETDQIESNILKSAKDIFARISSDLPDTILPTEEIHIYKQAVEMEKRSREFYKKNAEESELPGVEKTFNQLAKEEAKHQRILENIVELVDRPNTWLDDAEWYHLEDY